VVPSEDHSHGPPLPRERLSDEGRKTETEQQGSKKKTMKTNASKSNEGLLNRPEQLGRNRNRIDLARRRMNRALRTETLLTLLRSDAPEFYERAEVVGQWVWIHFPDRQPQKVTGALSELGFHWNRRRQSWQHPCGVYRNRATRVDPHRVFRTYFAADHQPA